MRQLLNRPAWVIVLAVLAVGGIALAANVANYSEPGGAKWVVGGEISIGGDQDLERVQVGSTAVLNGNTSIAATVSGALPGDYVFPVLVTNASSASTFISSAAVTTNTITIAVDQDPTTTQTVHYIWISTDSN